MAFDIQKPEHNFLLRQRSGGASHKQKNTKDTELLSLLRALILVPRGRDPFGQQQESRLLATLSVKEVLSNLTNLIA